MIVLDIVICTYNRPDQVRSLVETLLVHSGSFNKIFLIDSSENHTDYNFDPVKFHHVPSNHKNQPYQRLVGKYASKSEYLLFLDDDMELVNPLFFEELLEKLKDKKTVGIGIGFEDKHTNGNLHSSPKNRLKPKFINRLNLNFLKKWLGHPNLPEGTYYWNGNRGPKPTKFSQSEWFSGGAFVVKRELMFENNHLFLLDLFEQKLGMGEDMLIAYGLSKLGQLMYWPGIHFLHDEKRPSNYATNHFDFNRRVAFSRLFINKEYARMNGYSQFEADSRYKCYTFSRLFLFRMNALFFSNTARKDQLQGYREGIKLSKRLKPNSFEKSKEYWEKEAMKDAKFNG